MHTPEHFKVTDKNEIYAFFEDNAFGQLISNLNGRPCSSHAPFLLSSDKSKVYCHLAKQNTQVKNLDGQEVLVTLQGAHDYISPSWYVGSGVPTWNYQALHIYGRCKVFSDPDSLKRVVDTLTNKFESQFNKPWQPDYKSSMLGAIVGIEITITEIQCQYKLSQNRPPQDQKNVATQLKNNGSTLLADVMENAQIKQYKSDTPGT